MVANCTVISNLLVSDSKVPAYMALDNKLENSMNSPQIMRSLLQGGTGCNDNWVVEECIWVGSDTDWTAVDKA